jgi:hypothetical protein
MLLVSEHGTGFGLLPRVLVLIGLPALARSRWRDISDARRGAGSTRGRVAVQSVAKRCNPALPQLPAPVVHRNTPSRVDAKRKRRRIMRFILCIVLVMLLPASALAAKGSGAISLSRAQAAAARGDQQAAAALSTTTYRQACLSGCSARGHSKGQCSSACRPGVCHPSGATPYCVARR